MSHSDVDCMQKVLLIHTFLKGDIDKVGSNCVTGKTFNVNVNSLDGAKTPTLRPVKPSFHGNG